jgi:hypothetical protein
LDECRGVSGEFHGVDDRVFGFEGQLGILVQASTQEQDRRGRGSAVQLLEDGKGVAIGYGMAQYDEVKTPVRQDRGRVRSSGWFASGPDGFQHSGPSQEE